jgi:hypothetical protein
MWGLPAALDGWLIAGSDPGIGTELILNKSQWRATRVLVRPVGEGVRLVHEVPHFTDLLRKQVIGVKVATWLKRCTWHCDDQLTE